MVLTTDRLMVLQQEVDKVYVDPALIQYAVRMVTATRKPSDYGLKDLVGNTPSERGLGPTTGISSRHARLDAGLQARTMVASRIAGKSTHTVRALVAAAWPSRPRCGCSSR